MLLFVHHTGLALARKDVSGMALAAGGSAERLSTSWSVARHGRPHGARRWMNMDAEIDAQRTGG